MKSNAESLHKNKDIKIYTKLPNDIIQFILSYDVRFKYRNGKFMSQIPKIEQRYEILNTIQRKYDKKLQYDYIHVNKNFTITIFWGYGINKYHIDYYYYFPRNKKMYIHKIN